MNRIRSFVAVGLGILSLSMGGSGQSPLLTSGYGILTRDDIAITFRDTHSDCQDFGRLCPEYWACLPIESFSLDCELTDDREETFAPIIKMRAGGSSIEFFTRRPTSIEACEMTLGEWSNLLDGEEVACFLASYDPGEGVVPGSQFKYNLQLDRVKSHRGKWSYFMDLEWMPI
jgi:hypothetical protein